MFDINLNHDIKLSSEYYDIKLLFSSNPIVNCSSLLSEQSSGLNYQIILIFVIQPIAKN